MTLKLIDCLPNGLSFSGKFSDLLIYLGNAIAYYKAGGI